MQAVLFAHITNDHDPGEWRNVATESADLKRQLIARLQKSEQQLRHTDSANAHPGFDSK